MKKVRVGKKPVGKINEKHILIIRPLRIRGNKIYYKKALVGTIVDGQIVFEVLKIDGN